MNRSLQLAALAIGSLISAGCTFQSHSAEQTIESSLSARNVSVIEVSSFNGSVRVESHDQDLIHLRAVLKAFGESPQTAQATCAALKCEPVRKGDRLVIQSSRPNGQSSASVSVALKVPADCELQLRTSNGLVKVNAVNAPVTIKTSNGSVECRHIQGAIDLHTSNGRIEVSDATGPLHLHSSNGRVTYSGRPVGQDNRIETSNGRVALKLPADLKTSLKAKTSNGSIRVELPKSDVQEDSKKRFEGTVGLSDASAAATLTVKTSNGPVTVKEWDAAGESGDDVEAKQDLPAEAQQQSESDEVAQPE